MVKSIGRELTSMLLAVVCPMTAHTVILFRDKKLAYKKFEQVYKAIGLNYRMRNNFNEVGIVKKLTQASVGFLPSLDGNRDSSVWFILRKQVKSNEGCST